jgi:hypothetical protein
MTKQEAVIETARARVVGIAIALSDHGGADTLALLREAVGEYKAAVNVVSPGYYPVSQRKEDEHG